MAEEPAPSTLTVAPLTAGVAIATAAANRAADRNFDCLIRDLLFLFQRVNCYCSVRDTAPRWYAESRPPTRESRPSAARARQARVSSARALDLQTSHGHRRV